MHAYTYEIWAYRLTLHCWTDIDEQHKMKNGGKWERRRVKMLVWRTVAIVDGLDLYENSHIPVLII